VDTNVEAKVVRVTCSDSCDDQVLLTALQRWGNASGKAVALIN
jgi:coenzyme F420-reducing hydrogenase delta subunit